MSKLSYWLNPTLWLVTLIFIGGAWVGIYLDEVTNHASLALLTMSGFVSGMILAWSGLPLIIPWG